MVATTSRGSAGSPTTMRDRLNEPCTVRAETPADRSAVLAVVRAAFADHGERVAALVEELGGHRAVSLVADIGGQVVGHVQLSRSWLDARERLVDVLVLSPLGVVPARQGVGIGTALVQAAIRAAEDLGAPLVFLEGDPAYYARFGFEPGDRHGFLRPSVRIPEPAFQVRLLSSYEPWMRGALVYAEPFWTQDCAGLRDPRLAEIEARLAIPPTD